MWLEALVGDLEDAIYSVGDCYARNMFSTKIFTSLISTDFETKQERLLRAIKGMNNIEDVLVDVVKFHPQWSHLLESVDIRVDKILAIVRPQILADHRALLGSLGWPPKLLTLKVDSGESASFPNPLVLMEGEKRKYYSQSFLGLCTLQHLQTRREDRQHNIFGRKECFMKFWAIDELVSPIASRMEHHFSKWAEQPEFMFALVYKITRDFIVGVDDVLQPLIDRARLTSYSAREAWVSAMVQMLSGFLARGVVSVLAERYKEKHMKSEVISSWLHLIDHAVAFDKRMQLLVSSEIHFFEESKSYDSRCLSVLMIFCDRPDWLKIWTKIELKDAWKRLKLELKDERVWSIDKNSRTDFPIGAETVQFLLATREDYKAPLVTESALKITWEMIERCGTLPAVLPRVRFIRSTSARFLWHFLNVLALRCKNTEFLLDNSNDALIKVCGSINAARYIESKLQEWSDDVNFLELRIAERDLEINGNHDGVDNNSFFGEEVKSLLELNTNWLMDIISFLLHQFEELSWEYLQNKGYFKQQQENFTSNSIPANMELSVSIDIVEALDAIKTQLDLLKLNLNKKDFLDLWRSVADGLDQFIVSSISTSDIQFSSWGINQFEADMQKLFLVFQPYCARPEAFLPCIKETLKLLTMCEAEANYLQVVASNDENRTKCLRSFGILHLSFDQVDKILRNRKFET
ncbi:RINT1-like protein MAG2L isoform X2 [Jatropha curcas]|uniref:RINT1-like protein MAG2L isoform X2 n=1 Tax=Jatropha curcas TaxID=180498 RepID=UPI001892FF79|nr:RINT1-like protein MAG2L isoform X2 [Jatropha curcas]